tara:strand:- start:442 stop:723 length:282 start_codon:yes stop_codon:yes gene_type:complete
MLAKNKTIGRQDLLALIGRQIFFQHQQCEIVELLDDCKFVLQVLENDRNIQASQYGEGHRTVPLTYILPIFDGAGNIHTELLAADAELQNLLL